MFVDGKPLLDVQDLGSAEAILSNKRHLSEATRNFVKRGMLPEEDGWGGWLGRYQAALRWAAVAIQRTSHVKKTGLETKGLER